MADITTPGSSIERIRLVRMSDDADCSTTDGRQGEDCAEDESNWLAEVMTTWLGSIYKNSLWPRFEIGSMTFLRSQSYQALVEHMDKVGSFYYGGPRDVSMPMISAGIFSPREERLGLCSGRQRPELAFSRMACSPVKPKRKGEGAEGGEAGEEKVRAEPKLADTGGPKHLMEVMAESFVLWDQIRRDFDRQDGIPGLRSGNTVVDERNFVPT